MKHGFTLTEILISTAVASILSVALFYSYGQINKVFVSTKNYIDLYQTVLLVQHQLSKDLSGAFIPVQAVKPKEKKQSKDQATKQEPGKQPQTKEPDQAPSGQQEKSVPVLKDPFIIKNREKNMQMLSFVTNNATRVFVSKKTGEARPNTARVVYTLERDQNSSKDRPVYILYRQEGSELNLKNYTKSESAIERYALAHNIKSCALTLEVVVDQEDQDAKDIKQDTKQTAKETKKEVKKFNDWQLGKDEKDVRNQAKLPHKVTFKLVLWDDKQTREDEFTFTVVVMAKYHELPQIEPVKSAQAKTAANKQASPGAQNPANQRKQQLVSGANKVVNNIRTLLGA